MLLPNNVGRNVLTDGFCTEFVYLFGTCFRVVNSIEFEGFWYSKYPHTNSVRVLHPVHANRILILYGNHPFYHEPFEFFLPHATHSRQHKKVSDEFFKQITSNIL